MSEVGLDRTHIEETTIKHYTPSPYLEPPGQEEKGTSKKVLKAEAELQALDMTWSSAP